MLSLQSGPVFFLFFSFLFLPFLSFLSFLFAAAAAVVVVVVVVHGLLIQHKLGIFACCVSFRG